MRQGRLIAGRFELERSAGQGGMGVVYRAHDRHTGGCVAVKVLHGHLQDTARFEREARVLAALDHPAIVRHVAHGTTDDGSAYLAMEWLDGEDLAARLARGPMPIDEAVALALRVADALGLVHARGVVHRDIKPSNVFLPAGVVGEAKLLDFGIARSSAGSHVRTGTGMVLGTPGYMAPEQARGERTVDARADVFSLGCVLYESLTGEPAFCGEHLMAVLAKILLAEAPRVRSLRPVPAPLDALVASMLAKSRDGRPADGVAAGAALRGLATALPIPEPQAERAPAITGRERRLVSVVLASGQEDLAAAPTITPAESAALRERVLSSLARFDPQLEWLADGSLVLIVPGMGPATDQAAHAARCALALRAAIPEVTIVLATGRAELSETLPVGEVIDRAVALLKTKQGRVSIGVDAVTAGLLDRAFEVAGDEDGFELRGEHVAFDTPRTLLGRATPFVGRDRELAALDGFLSECGSESIARAVLVTAPPGCGKSRLRHEFLARLRGRREPVQTWLARGAPMGRASPFGMVGQLLAWTAGIVEGESPSSRRHKLSARVGRRIHASGARRVAEFLGEIVGCPFADDESVALKAARADPALMAEQTGRAFVEFVLAECAAGVLLLVLEDLHWGDQPSVALLSDALRAARETPLMVLALARPELHATFPNVWADRGSQEIRLGELPRKASERLVRVMLGDDVPRERVAAIVERAGGHALYLEELIRASTAGADALPGTVLAMVQARVEALPHDARQVLRAAAVYGEVFWRRAVVSLLGQEPRAKDVGALLDRLCGQEILVRLGTPRFPGEDEYGFRHALFRDAAYAMLTDDDRALAHRLAADWLERAGEDDPVLLAEHRERGGDADGAFRGYLAAAAAARAGYQLHLAIDLYRRARDVAPGADLQRFAANEALEDLYRSTGAMDRRREALERMASEVRSPREAAISLVRRARHELDAQRVGPASRLATLAAEAAERSEDGDLLLEARCLLADALRDEGRVAEALHLADDLVRYCDEHPSVDPMRLGSVVRSQGILLRRLGRMDEAIAAYERSIDVLGRVGALRAEALSRNALGYSMFTVARYERAVEVCKSAVVRFRTTGSRFQLGKTLSNIGQSYWRLGDESRALAFLKRAHRAHRLYSDEDGLTDLLLVTAQIAIAAGAAPWTRGLLDEARERVAWSPGYDATNERLTRALYERACGSPSAAADVAAAARSLAVAGSLASFATYATAIEAEARSTAGEAGLALELARRASSLVAEVPSEYTLEACGLIARAARGHDDAIATQAVALGRAHVAEVLRHLRSPRLRRLFSARVAVREMVEWPT